MNGIFRVIPLVIFLLSVNTTSINVSNTKMVNEKEVTLVDIYERPVASFSYEPIEVEVDIVIEEPLMSKEDIDLIALVTMAEAEGECEEGKRLVISTILNRMDSTYFPDTAHDVIYQRNAFSSMWNGRVDRCVVLDDIVDLVIDELDNRTNYDVVFFTAGQYGKYGRPLFQVGNHYFASYE
ncbi:MAG: cell wall hydrolase [Vallitaleaceae bacterium]|nr:cell wall hydrolase [Vallitaleaceae bacterium]